MSKFSIVVLTTTTLFFYVSAKCVNENNVTSVTYLKSKMCTKDWCFLVDTDSNDTRLQDVTFTKIYLTSPIYFPLVSCAFYKLTSLAVIDGSSAGIDDIEKRAFVHLPNLKSLYLPYNTIALLRDGFFEGNSSLEVLDLSWNKLFHVEEGALENFNLQALNLSRNELTYFRIQKGLSNLKELILSYNKLKVVDQPMVNGLPRVPRNLTLFDLSFNQLTFPPAMLCEEANPCEVKKFDLTHNQIWESRTRGDFKNVKIGELRLSYNLLFLSIIVFPALEPPPESVSISAISIYPNPWICDVYWMQTIETLNKRNVTFLPLDSDSRFNFTSESPICVEPSQESSEVFLELVEQFVVDKGEKCGKNKDCPDDKMCRNNHCWNPCNYGACRNANELCVTSNHRFSCNCPRNTIRKPFDYFSRCYHVECFVGIDCPHLKCTDHICE